MAPRRAVVVVIATALLVSGLLVVYPAHAQPLSVRLTAPRAEDVIRGQQEVIAATRGPALAVSFEWSRDRGTTWEPIGIDLEKGDGWSWQWTLPPFRGEALLRATASDGLSSVADRIHVWIDMNPPVLTGTASYSGLATWVDLYNWGPWEQPIKTIRAMSNQGVQTLFLETSNYKHGRGIVHPQATGKLIDEAHARGLSVVAWYVPGFARLEEDERRIKKAIDFTSPDGGHFDSFAMDIEATVIADISERNRRMLILSKRIRLYVGNGYTLGAIIPDPVHSLYWPGFPYKRVDSYFDVFLPMSYYTYRTTGYQNVHEYIRANIKKIRRETENAGVPIHVIGGLAGITTRKEVRGLVDSSLLHEAYGVSLYDFPITEPDEWKELARVRDIRSTH